MELSRSAERAYEPVADIAQGGMGRVELVVRREGAFARIYAMKRLRPELLDEPDVRTMFLEEARIAGLVRHPNVVPVLDVGEDEHGPYLVMDYVEGVAAYKPIVAARGQGGDLPLALCVEIARQTAHGLAAAHELEGAGGRPLGVVHRDVSPQNILLGFDGLVRVTDFGVARALDHRSATEGGLIKGKIGYMSPEQILREPLDARSDLFSFGVVLVELLLGGRLYGGPVDDAFRRIRHEPAPDVRTARPDVPDELGELVRDLLAKDRTERPESAREVVDRLDTVAGSLAEEADLARYLESEFSAERAAQRRLISAALERTDAELSLADIEAAAAELSAERFDPDADTVIDGADEVSTEQLVATEGTATEPFVSRGARRLAASADTIVVRPRSRRPLARTIAAAVAAAALLGGAAWWGGALLAGDEPRDPPSAAGASGETAASPSERDTPSDAPTESEPALPAESRPAATAAAADGADATGAADDSSASPSGGEEGRTSEAEPANRARRGRTQRARRRGARQAAEEPTGSGLSKRAWSWDEGRAP